MNDFRQLAGELIACIDDGQRFAELYPLLRELEPLHVAMFGPSEWPAFSIGLDGHDFVLRMRHPRLDQFTQARLVAKHPTQERCSTARVDAIAPLSDTDDKELRDHIRSLLSAWLREAERAVPNADGNTAPTGNNATPLTNNDRSILAAMLELNATPEKPEPGDDIIKAALGQGDKKHAFDRLKAARLVATKKGPFGWWLTDAGRQTAEKV